MKIGLCLAGGGAKGAFQAGVIYGLYERGLDFDVISGTSIGAINGYYIYTKNVNKLKEMWINIQTIG
ncbi:patatin-like phospholipase family protein, partial [Alistipes putredinis]|nr:patatin-like phospholipase family protein [Alistipes putredinis]